MTTHHEFFVPRHLIRDHLYETCPGYQRSPGRRGWGTIDVAIYLDPEYPYNTDICGWCLRVWTARHREAVSR